VDSKCKNGNHILTKFLPHPEFLDVLLRAKADPDAKDAFGNSALWLAARGGNSKAILSLIKNGADVMYCSPAQKMVGESVLRYSFGCYGVDGSVAVKSRQICNSTEAGTNALQAAKLHFPSEISSSWEMNPKLAMTSIEVLLNKYQEKLKTKLSRDVSIVHMLYNEILNAVGDEGWCYGGLARNWDPQTAILEIMKKNKKRESKEHDQLKIYLRINPKNTWQVFQVVGYYEGQGQQTQAMGFRQEHNGNQVLILRQVIVRKFKNIKKGGKNVTLGPRVHLSIRDLNSKTYAISGMEGIHFGAFEEKKTSCKSNSYNRERPRAIDTKENPNSSWCENCDIRINQSSALDRRLGRAFVLSASSWSTSIDEAYGE